MTPGSSSGEPSVDQTDVASPTSEAINSILAERSPSTSLSSSSPNSPETTSNASVVPSTADGPHHLTEQVHKTYMNSTSSELPGSEPPEVTMNVSAIKNAEPVAKEPLHPCEDPVFIENMKSTYKSLRAEYLSWSKSPLRNYNSMV